MTDTNPLPVEELLPCPFCGGVNVSPCDDGADNRSFEVSCNDCFAATRYHDTEAEAIAAWNTRAPVSISPLLTTEAGKLADDIDDTVTRLCKLNEKMTRAVQQQRPYPVSIALGDDDTWTVLHAAIVLERAKAALRQSPPQMSGDDVEYAISAWAFAHDIDGAARNDLLARIRALSNNTKGGGGG